MSNVMVTGASSGLGREISTALTAAGHLVFEYNLEDGCDVRYSYGSGVDWDAIELDVLINCAGVNKINWLENLTEREWDEVMDTNAMGIWKMAQAAHPALKRSGGTILNIVSNAAHMPMRCSAAYNASKGAALILTKQLARELITDDITVFSISPNKLRGTGMSNDIDEQVMKTRGWTRKKAQEYQLNGLLTCEETDPRQLAEFITYLLRDKDTHKMLAGCDLQYGL